MASDEQMHIPEVCSFGQIIARARQKAESGRKQQAALPQAALVVPSSVEALRAFERAVTEGIVDPVVVGDERLFAKNVAELDLKLDGANVIDVNQPDLAVKTAAQMAARGDVDLIVQGRMGVVELLRLLFEKDSSFVVKGKTVSHVAVMKPERYQKLLMLTDSAVIPQPDLKQKLGLIQNAISFSRSIGVSSPRVAVLAAVEVIYPQMPVTTDAAILSKMAERKQIKGGHVDGPLSFDVAVDMVAAHSKGIITSEVAGQADVLIAPNIETAYGVYTAMAMYGHAETGGILFGGRVPVAVSSHFESADARYNSIALAVAAACG